MKAKKRKFDEVSRGSGIEVCFKPNWFEDAPRCEHGPMLLFESYFKGSLTKSFYACSASRNRKECKATTKDYLKTKKVHNYCMRYDEVVIIPPSRRSFCLDCQMFVFNDEVKHKQHKLKENLTNGEMLQPSKFFLTPKENNKLNAQYFINTEAVALLSTTLIKFDITRVVCVGMPRLHEHIQTHHECRGMKSLLLDIDNRFDMFWPRSKFIRFNLFNRYFFSDDGFAAWEDFVKDSGKVAIMLDPPFGGLVDCVVQTLTWMETEIAKKNEKNSSELTFKIFWLFPYFMESRIAERLEQLTMLDYQVSYENHKKYHKETSPVRIFTNVENSKIVLPAGRYKFCAICKRYVHRNNKHCKLCKTCPSKDGRAYTHCNFCNKCVKPGRKHCSACNRCALTGHICHAEEDIVGCHKCGDVSHRRRDCPSSDSVVN